MIIFSAPGMMRTTRSIECGSGQSQAVYNAQDLLEGDGLTEICRSDGSNIGYNML
jgi:hypothetical protein